MNDELSHSPAPLADVSALINALELPADCRVNFRVPKARLLENAVYTVSDKKQINEGIEEIRWVASIKPDRIGVATYEDAERSYLEIAVITCELRPAGKPSRIVQLLHRSIAYPILLILCQDNLITLSTAQKRHSQGQADAWVLDGTIDELPLETEAITRSIIESLPLRCQPRANLYALYQGWAGVLTAGRVAAVTGNFQPSRQPDNTDHRKNTLAKLESLHRDVKALRKAAATERQMSRQVELNLKVKQLEAEIQVIKSHLTL